MFLYLAKSRLMVGASRMLSELGNTWSERLQRTTEVQGGVFEMDVVENVIESHLEMNGTPQVAWRA